MKILVIYPEIKTARSLEKGLVEKGFQVDVLITDQDVTSIHERTCYQLIIQDEMVVSHELLKLSSGIRESQGASVLILCEVERGGTPQDLKSYHYLVKPFDFHSLVDLIKQILESGREQVPEKHVLITHDLVIDVDMRCARRGESDLLLTPKEFDLLQYLFEKRGAIVSLSELASRVWRRTVGVDNEFVKQYMSYLCKKVDGGHSEKLIGVTAQFGYFIQL